MSADRLDRLRQQLSSGRHAVELPAAVVRDDDRSGAVLAGKSSVLLRLDPLDDDRQRRVGHDLLEISPAERRVDPREHLERRRAAPAAGGRGDARDDYILGHPESGAKVTLAAAETRRVDCEHDRSVARLGSLVDERVRDTAVAEHVELEPAWRARCRRGDLSRRGRGNRREAHDRPGRRGRTCGPQLSIRMSHPVKGRGRDEHRHRDLSAEHGRRRRRALHVDEDTRSQPVSAPGFDVLPQRPLVAGAAGEVPECAFLEDALGEPLVVGDGERLAHAPNLSV
jgi:hypothetical protein